MSENDSLISKLLKQKQSAEDGAHDGLNEFAMDIEFPQATPDTTEE